MKSFRQCQLNLHVPWLDVLLLDAGILPDLLRHFLPFLRVEVRTNDNGVSCQTYGSHYCSNKPSVLPASQNAFISAHPEKSLHSLLKFSSLELRQQLSWRCLQKRKFLITDKPLRKSTFNAPVKDRLPNVDPGYDANTNNKTQLPPSIASRSPNQRRHHWTLQQYVRQL